MKDKISFLKGMNKNLKITGIIIIVAVIASLLWSLKSRRLNMDQLTPKQQSIVLISSYTIKGDMEKLNTALIDGLENGLSINEIKEVFLQMASYAGFPRSLNGITTFQKLIAKREAEGTFDIMGNLPTKLPAGTNKNEYGQKVRANLIGSDVKGDYATFFPAIDDFLKEHLFADTFGRGVLSNEDRELATISALSSVEGLGAQLKGHLKIGLNVGLKSEQLENIISSVGVKGSDQVLKEVLSNKEQKNQQEVQTKETIGTITKQAVRFKNRIGIMVAGDLYMPANIDPSKKYSAIIVGHPFTGVKEQTAGLYAQSLAEQGFITLAFDASFWGESGGNPRNIEVPEIRVEDFSAATDFLSNHALVDPNRIGVVGICGSGGYSLSATAIDHRIKAVVTVSMYDLGRARRQGLGDVISFEQRMKTLDLIGELRTKEFRGEPRTDIAAIPAKITDKDTENTHEFYDYYRTPRGQSPKTDTTYSLISQAMMMNSFPFSQIETISPRPILFIVGERAVSKYFSDQAYSLASEPKEMFVVPNASHVDLYDRPEYLKITVPKIVDFFTKNLTGEAPKATANDAKIQVMYKKDFSKSQVPADKFTGKAEVEYISGMPNSSNGLVFFNKGARTAWHTHPKGQLLIIHSGVGRIQQEGGDIIKLNAGDVIWIPAGIKHWHGADINSEMSHYALTGVRDGISANWMEKVK